MYVMRYKPIRGFLVWILRMFIGHNWLTPATVLPFNFLTPSFTSWGRRFSWPNKELESSEADKTFRHTVKTVHSFASIKISIQNDYNRFSNRFICLYESENLSGSNIVRCCQWSSRNIPGGMRVRSAAMNYVHEIIWWRFLIGNTGEYVTLFCVFYRFAEDPPKVEAINTCC
jgi:hypothetical protein